METTIITCESCQSPIFPKNEDPTKRFPVRYHKFDALCQTCYNQEKAAFEANQSSKPIMQDTLEVIVTKREEFFNAEKTDIGLIAGTAFERVLKIRDRIDKWKNLLFEVRVRTESAQAELQKLAAGITDEERTKLKISDLTYTPNSAQPKPKVARVSASEKSAVTIAKILYKKEIALGEMTEEEAIKKAKDLARHGKNIMITRMAEGTLKCSCQETPGICKVHSV